MKDYWITGVPDYYIIGVPDYWITDDGLLDYG
jgi:hypothetical protein